MSKDKGYIICYDRTTLPDGLTLKEVVDLTNKGFCLYDSSKGASVPSILHLGGDKNKKIINCKIIDVYEHSRKS